MNAGEAAAVQLACGYVEDGRLVALAAVAMAGGTPADAAEAVRTRTMLGGCTEAGTVWATPAGLRVWLPGEAPVERRVTWTQVANVLTPVLTGRFGALLLTAHGDRVAARDADGPELAAAADRQWRTAKAAVLASASTTITVQPSLFDAAPTPLRGRRAGRSL